MDGPTPDRSFMAALKTLDKDLGIKFNGKHFVVTYRVRENLTVNIWKVVAGDGGFRQPDRRDLEILQQSNIEKESPEEKQARVERYMAAVREKDRKNAREMIRNQTKDNKIQLYNAYARANKGGKHNSTFRRVSPEGPRN